MSHSKWLWYPPLIYRRCVTYQFSTWSKLIKNTWATLVKGWTAIMFVRSNLWWPCSGRTMPSIEWWCMQIWFNLIESPFTGCYNPLIYCYMNARFRSGFITVLHRLPGFQKFCAKRFRGGTNRYPNKGESIILALNHQSYINKVNKKSNRVVKNDDYFNDGGINGTD